jgi:hypothetical protein
MTMRRAFLARPSVVPGGGDPNDRLRHLHEVLEPRYFFALF